MAGERRRPDPAGIVWVCPPAVGAGGGGCWESVLLDVGWTDLQRVLLTPILWAVNRRPLWESVICTPLTPPHPHPRPRGTSCYWSLSGCEPAPPTPTRPTDSGLQWSIIVGFSLTAVSADVPILLLDPTHL